MMKIIPLLKQFPDDVQAYLNEEAKFGAILGPFDSPPIQKLHISPFMTRDKPRAPHRRIIVDLCFPIAISVNAGINQDIYLQTSTNTS